MKAKWIVFSAIVFLTACVRKTDQLFFIRFPQQTGIDFVNEVRESDSVNVNDYFYIFNGAGVAVGDINHDGLDDIFFSANNRGRNRLYLNQGQLTFKDITDQAGVQGKADWSTGVTMVDINADGWLDIYVCTVHIEGVFNSRNELYINNRNETFTEAASDYGLDFSTHSTQSAFFDYDKDGVLDCFILNHATSFYESFRPAGNRNLIDSLSGDKLLRGRRQLENGVVKLKYVPVPAGAHTYYSSPLTFGLGISIGDLNNDGWLDIYATNDFREQDYCYFNNGDGTFKEKGSTIFGHHSRFSMGCDMADYNNDGRLDLITLDMLPEDEKVLKSSVGDEFSDVYDYKKSYGFHNQYSRNCLQTNLVSGDSLFFTDVGLQAGVAATDWSWSALLADFDDDGNKDLFITNGYLYRANDLDFAKFKSYEILKAKEKAGASKFLNLSAEMPSGKVHDYIYKGTGRDDFRDKSMEWGFTQSDISHGAAYSDLDNDGDLDLIVNRMNDFAAIYENRSNRTASNSISIQLKGKDGNTQGIGASVYVFNEGGLQMLQQMPTRGFMSSVSPTLHFGIGQAVQVDSVLVIWPSGFSEVINSVKANSRLQLLEVNASLQIESQERTHKRIAEIKEVTNELGIDITHRQGDFNDFSANPFIPHKVSFEGMPFAIADVDEDGNEDFFMDTVVYLMKNESSKKNNSRDRIRMPVGAPPNTVDALFFDADKDGDQDLITVSGGNEFSGLDERLRDHLYTNNGDGKFIEDASFPALYENKSCVKACDFDKDGDLDLFIGGRVNGRMFGMIPASHLLRNDGEGHFTSVAEEVAPELSFLGMTTDATWRDVDGDGWSDLIVVGQFMPITLFKNQQGKRFSKQPFVSQVSTGFWNCILPTDVDQDGDLDFLVGNIGTNSKLKATERHPLKLYMVDYDNNGEQDALLTICKNDQYYPFLGKEELEKRLPVLKKRFLKYSDMAGKTAEEIFGDKLKEARVLEVGCVESSVIINEEGNYFLKALPPELQKAPIFAFQSMSSGNEFFLLAGGNLYGTQPFEGRYDALPLTLFTLKSNAGRLKLENHQHVFLPGQIMNIQELRNTRGRKIFLVARNDQPLVAFEVK
jgi:hypothetical protein